MRGLGRGPRRVGPDKPRRGAASVQAAGGEQAAGRRRAALCRLPSTRDLEQPHPHSFLRSPSFSCPPALPVPLQGRPCLPAAWRLFSTAPLRFAPSWHR